MPHGSRVPSARANLTLSIDDKLLQAARIRAVKERTSVNEICRQALEADARPSAAQRLERYRRLQAAIDAAPQDPPLAAAWARRAELYDQVLDERHPSPQAARRKPAKPGA